MVPTDIAFMKPSLAPEAELAGLAVQAAASELQNLGPIEIVGTKSPNNITTSVDLALESAIIRVLSAHSPFPIQAEERSPQEVSPTRWVVDPLDGTYNFATGSGPFAIAASLLVDNIPTHSAAWLSSGDLLVADSRQVLLNGELVSPLSGRGNGLGAVHVGDFTSRSDNPIPNDVRLSVIRSLATRSGNVRLTGSTVSDFAGVALGWWPTAIAFHNSAWDVSSGIAMIRAGGGHVSDLNGLPWTLASHSALVSWSAVGAARIIEGAATSE